MKSSILQKDHSIEMLKALAAILITNSHMNRMYGDWKVLASGGAIGDALFFFCAGYTLFWSKEGSYINWYKRRINRIFPTLIAWALLHISFSMNQIVYSMKIDLGAGWFFPCIFLFYAIIFPLKKFIKEQIGLTLGICSIIIIAWYIFFGIESVDHNIYGATYFKWALYFPIMIIGSIIGHNSREKRNKNEEVLYKAIPSLLNVVISVICFYVICSFKNRTGYEAIQLLSVFPLISIIYFLWKLCNSKISNNLMKNNFLGPSILFIGSLCLEIYVGQEAVFTTSLNHIFPLNIPILIIGVIAFAFILRCFARLWSQTFRESSYNWKEIIKPI